MKKQVTLALASVAAASLFTTIASAGNKALFPVQIDTVNRWAAGQMGSARNAADTNQAIGCWLTATTAGRTGGCSAVNAAGTTVTCSIPSTSTAILATVESFGVDSAIQFYYNASAVCTSVQVWNVSSYEPKQP